MMHIVHVLYAFQVGGAETMLVDIINGQVARGHKVTMLIVNTGIDPDLIAQIDPKVKVIAMNRKPGSLPLLMMGRLNWTLRKLRPDIIHCHDNKFGFLVRVRRNRLLVTLHTVNEPMKYCGRSQMVAISDAVEADIRARVKNPHVTTILNGIRIGDIAVRPSGAPHSPFRIIQVSRLVSDIKGQDLLIRALGELRDRGIEDVEVSFIGTGPDADALSELAKSLGVADRVHFLGLRDRDYIYSHLADYDAMVHPSRAEGFGLAIAEAMAAGLPLAVTTGDGPWEVADHGRLCESFPKDDHKACADAILKIRNDYQTIAPRTNEAREYVKRFDISRTVDNYIDFYRSLM